MKYVPHEYQRFATDFIVTHPTAAIFLDMGMGKSSITLTAIERLMYQEFEVRKVLIIAPLRVAKNTWPAEIQKWDHLNGLTWSVIIGTQQERMAALRREADIYLINRENTQWLIEKSGMPFDYDMVVIDELSSFKSWQSKRFRSLMKVRPFVRRIVGLTGTPSSMVICSWLLARLKPASPLRTPTRTSSTPMTSNSMCCILILNLPSPRRWRIFRWPSKNRSSATRSTTTVS